MSILARTTTLGTTLTAALAFGVVATVLPPAGSATGAAFAQSADDLDAAGLLEEFIHYTRVAKPSLAVGYGQELLDRGLTNAELAAIVDDGGFDLERLDTALQRALRVEELERIAAEIGRRIESGRHDLARESDRIDAAIGMLSGTQRQQILGRSRLEAAGEYAVPALLRAIVESKNEKVRLECIRLLSGDAIGRMAVTPLCVALDHLDAENQALICRILGEIGYSHAGPYLRAVMLDDSASQPVRDAASQAFNRIVGGDDSVSALFAGLSRQYFRDLGSLIAYPFEDMNNVWAYDAFVGLVPTPVPTSIFNEVMAMQTAEHALHADAANETALVLYIASNLKRENDLGDDEADPVYGDEVDRTPAYYATVFGTNVCQSVLALALDSRDTPLVRDAIAALSQTTGGSNLLAAGGSRIPLVEALGYPDRRVLYEAALTLGNALPSSSFSGDNQVVPILASSVRTGNELFAMVVCDDEENLTVERTRLENQLGYTVLGAEPSVDLLTDAMGDAIAVDLVVVRMGSAAGATQATAALRRLGRTAAAPVVVVASAVDLQQLTVEYRGNSSIAVTRTVDDAAFESVVDTLLNRSAGGRLSDAEADEYAILALETLQRIAIASTVAYNIADAETALLDSLGRRAGSLRQMVAGIIAYVDSERAQQALFDAALTSTNAREQAGLLDATAASVRRFGNRADQRHIVRLRDLVRNGTGNVAEAAARVHGSLNLPTAGAIPLITENDG